LEQGRAFLVHGFVEQDAEAFGEIGGTLRGKELQNGVEQISIAVAGLM